jgi:hypothetical protein
MEMTNPDDRNAPCRVEPDEAFGPAPTQAYIREKRHTLTLGGAWSRSVLFLLSLPDSVLVARAAAEELDDPSLVLARYWSERGSVQRDFESGQSARQHDVVVVNPLGGALHHYSNKLLQTLAAAGVDATAITVFEPSVSGGSRKKWLLDYLAALARARRLRRRGGRVLVTWPVLGHWDRVLIRFLSGRQRGMVVMHDPRPLVAAVGYSPISVRLSRVLAPRTSLMVHSELAEDDLSSQHLRSTLLPHPIVASQNVRMKTEVAVVRVLGQWKPDRDIALLSDLVAHLPNIALEIVGRGWPAVAGWKVRNEFVTEEELDELVISSTVVLIPYQRYYQSGIAARALELAVPVVGRKKELASMTGDDYPFLVDAPFQTESWLSAIGAAMLSDERHLEDVRSDVASRALHAWSEWSRS